MTLKEYLKENRWTITAFATAIGVDRRTVYNYMDHSTKPSEAIIFYMAQVLKISKTRVKDLLK